MNWAYGTILEDNMTDFGLTNHISNLETRCSYYPQTITHITSDIIWYAMAPSIVYDLRVSHTQWHKKYKFIML